MGEGAAEEAVGPPRSANSTAMCPTFKSSRCQKFHPSQLLLEAARAAGRAGTRLRRAVSELRFPPLEKWKKHQPQQV